MELRPPVTLCVLAAVEPSATAEDYWHRWMPLDWMLRDEKTGSVYRLTMHAEAPNLLSLEHVADHQPTDGA